MGDNNANTCSVKTMNWTSVSAGLGMEETLQPSWESASARGAWCGTIASYSARLVVSTKGCGVDWLIVMSCKAR